MIGSVEDVLCVKLKELEISRMGLKEVPNFVKSLTMLEKLALVGNNLRSVPVEVGKLPNITSILVSSFISLHPLCNRSIG